MVKQESVENNRVGDARPWCGTETTTTDRQPGADTETTAGNNTQQQTQFDADDSVSCPILVRADIGARRENSFLSPPSRLDYYPPSQPDYYPPSRQDYFQPDTHRTIFGTSTMGDAESLGKDRSWDEDDEFWSDSTDQGSDDEDSWAYVILLTETPEPLRNKSSVTDRSFGLSNGEETSAVMLPGDSNDRLENSNKVKGERRILGEKMLIDNSPQRNIVSSPKSGTPTYLKPQDRPKQHSIMSYFVGGALSPMSEERFTGTQPPVNGTDGSVSRCVELGGSFNDNATTVSRDTAPEMKKRFSCRECGWKFRDRHDWVRHEKQHKKKSMRRCPVCQKQMQDTKWFQKHVRRCKEDLII